MISPRMGVREQVGMFTAILIGMFLSGNTVGTIVVAVLIGLLLNLPEIKKEQDVNVQALEKIEDLNRQFKLLEERLEIIRISKR